MTPCVDMKIVLPLTGVKERLALAPWTQINFHTCRLPLSEASEGFGMFAFLCGRLEGRTIASSRSRYDAAPLPLPSWVYLFLA